MQNNNDPVTYWYDKILEIKIFCTSMGTEEEEEEKAEDGITGLKQWREATEYDKKTLRKWSNVELDKRGMGDKNLAGVCDGVSKPNEG